MGFMSVPFPGAWPVFLVGDFLGSNDSCPYLVLGISGCFLEELAFVRIELSKDEDIAAGVSLKEVFQELFQRRKSKRIVECKIGNNIRLTVHPSEGRA
jgi:hypothetical protein